MHMGWYINKDTDEEERNTGGCWPAATHTALSLVTPRQLCHEASRQQLQSSDDSDKADIGQDIIVGHHTDDHG